MSTPPIEKWAPVRPFAIVIMSGCEPSRWAPNHSPIRPNAQITSSETSRIPYLSQISRSPSQYPAGGVIEPPAFWTGSMMIIAIVSGRSKSMASSISASSAFVNAASSSPAGCR